MSESDVIGYEPEEHSLGWWLEHGDRWPVQREPRRLTDASLRMALACLRYATMLEEDAPHAIRDAMTVLDMGPIGSVCEGILLALPTLRRDRMMLLPSADLRMLREPPITLEVDFTCDRCGDVVWWHGRSWSFVPALMEHGTRESSGLWCGGEGWRSGHRRGPLRYHALWELAPPHKETR